MRLRSPRFGFDPEITAHFLLRSIRIAEVPITYRPRTWKQGHEDSLQRFASGPCSWCFGPGYGVVLEHGSQRGKAGEGATPPVGAGGRGGHRRLFSCPLGRFRRRALSSRKRGLSGAREAAVWYSRAASSSCPAASHAAARSWWA